MNTRKNEIYILKVKEYTLDPDYRKTPPKDKLFCARCQKEITDASKAVKITVSQNGHNFKLGGEELLGSDCWKKCKKKTN